MNSPALEQIRTANGATEEPAGRYRALALLAFATFLEMTPWFSASAVLPQLRVAWGVTPSAGSWLTISVQLGFVAGALVSAALSLADIFPPRRLMLIGGLLAAAFNAAILASHSFSSALPLRFFTGASLALVYPPSLKAMATWFRRGRGFALGVMIAGLTLGSAMPQLLNGLGGVRWQNVLIATSILTIAGALLAEFGGHEGPFPFARAVFNPSEFFRVFSDQGVRLSVLGYFGHMWELYAMWTWCAAFFADAMRAHGVGDPQRSAAFAAFAAIGIGSLGCAIGGSLGDSWGRTRTVITALSVSGACALAIGFSVRYSLALAIGIGIIWGFAVVADSGQFSTMVTETADQSYVGTALTMMLAIGFTLTVATIWLVPVIRDSHGWPMALAALAPGPALGILAMYRLMHSPEAARLAGGRG
jgi:MFS family permease